MAHDVFICHASEDATVAGAVCKGLEDAGVRCWIAPRDVPAGAHQARAAIQGLRASVLVVLVYSFWAGESERVIDEVQWATSVGLPVILYRIEDMSLSADLMRCIRSPHWVDAFALPEERRIPLLAEAVRARLDRLSAASSLQPEKPGLVVAVWRKAWGSVKKAFLAAEARVARWVEPVVDKALDATHWSRKWHTDGALEAYERRWRVPLLVVSIFYLVIAFVEILPRFYIPTWLRWLDGALMAVFVVDYSWRVLALAPRGRHYWRTRACLLDLIVIVTYPFVVLGYGAAGLTRAFRILATLARFTRAGAMAGKTLEGAHRVFTKRSVVWMGPLIILIAGLVTVYIWRAELEHGDKLLSAPGQALWWAIDMLMTGDSETSPHTTQSHVLAVIIALLGIALFGIITAWLAAAFVENDEAGRDEEIRQTRLLVKVLSQQVDELCGTIAGLERLGADVNELRRALAGLDGLSGLRADMTTIIARLGDQRQEPDGKRPAGEELPSQADS